MPAPVGVAVIGTGQWGRRLTAAVQRTPSLRPVTVYSRSEDARTAAAQEFNCQAAPDFEQALTTPGVEAVLLVTPNHVHAAQLAACATRGLHVFVEKPIADTLADAVQMQTVAAVAGITLFVGHGFRRLGAARRVQQLLAEGALGTVVLAEANFSLPGRLTPDRWRSHRETCPGGPLMQLGVHHADTLQAWLGPVAAVSGSFAHVATAADIDDVGVALLEFATGARGVLTGSYVSPKTYDLRLYGSAGVLEYHTDMSIWPHADQMDAATTLTLRTKTGSEAVTFTPRDMLVDELDEFARCVRGEAVPETGAVEGLRALRVILGALEAHERGQRVPLPAEAAATPNP